MTASSSQEHVRMMIVKLQDHFPLRVTDWLLTCILLTWGVVAFWIDPSTWNQPIYSGLHSWSPAVWGLIGVTIGLCRIVFLVVNGSLRRTPHLRAAGAFFSCWVWWWLTLGMLTADQITFGSAIYPWLLLGDVYNVYRAARDARSSDVRAREKLNARGTEGHATAPAR